MLASTVLGMIVGASGQARADLIIGNYPESTAGGGSARGELTMAVEFTTGPAAQSLGSAMFTILASNATVTVTLNATNAGNPATPGATLDTLITPPNITPEIDTQTAIFSAAAPIPLDPNSRYWIQLRVTPGTDASFAFDSAAPMPTGPGATYDATFYDVTAFTIKAGIPYVELDSPSTAVPEPSTAVVATFGAVALGAYGWSRHRRAQRRPAAA
jgi:hypothetical protein